MLEMFRNGHDTFDIARANDMTEAEAYNELHRLRCRERGLPYKTEKRLLPSVGSIKWHNARAAIGAPVSADWHG